MKKLSIITVCLNAESSIQKTLLSVASQTFQEYEYIIIDGGSSDNTLSIIKQYESIIDYLISEKDYGIFDAQNKGAEHSNCDYLLFLNAGDFLCNDRVIETIFNNNPIADIVYGDIVYLLKSGIKYRKKSPSVISSMYMLLDSLPHPSSLIKKTLFDRMGGFNARIKFSADYDFFLKAIFSDKCSYQYISIPVSVFNLEGVSSNKKNKRTIHAERKKSQIKYLKFEDVEKFYRLGLYYDIKYKKIPYSFNFLKSIISKKYLDCD